MKKVLIALAALALLAGIGAMLFRHFVTNSIADKGGMENPFITDTASYDGAER